MQKSSVLLRKKILAKPSAGVRESAWNVVRCRGDEFCGELIQWCMVTVRYYSTFYESAVVYREGPFGAAVWSVTVRYYSTFYESAVVYFSLPGAPAFLL